MPHGAGQGDTLGLAAAQPGGVFADNGIITIWQAHNEVMNIGGFGGLFEFSHAYAWNHGILIMPYFNMLIVTPQHSLEDTDRWLPVWDDMIRIVMGG